MSAASSIAVDWGTTRLRAYLFDADGAILDRREGSDGIMSVPAGGFAATLAGYVDGWLAADASLPVVMAGMVGSRNGWAEAPYAPCPASARDLADRLIRVRRADGGEAAIIPGVAGVFDGAADVMRGEETLVAGLDLEDGLACLPGTHAKWVLLRGGRIERFSTFMTGEIYGALIGHTILGRLVAEPADDAGFALGLRASRQASGLLHAVFAARANVLLETMAPGMIKPYLSGLLIGAEVAGALALYGDDEPVHLVADHGQAALYGQALEAADVEATIVEPDAALLKGLARITSQRSR
jgi:2-dehydro-3-deoxygalactonokinase